MYTCHFRYDTRVSVRQMFNRFIFGHEIEMGRGHGSEILRYRKFCVEKRVLRINNNIESLGY